MHSSNETHQGTVVKQSVAGLFKLNQVPEAAPSLSRNICTPMYLHTTIHFREGLQNSASSALHLVSKLMVISSVSKRLYITLVSFRLRWVRMLLWSFGSMRVDAEAVIIKLLSHLTYSMNGTILNTGRISICKSCCPSLKWPKPTLTVFPKSATT